MPCRLAAKDFQRNVDRPGDMLGLVLLSKQHIDELRPVPEKLTEPIPIDLHHHRDTLAAASQFVASSAESVSGLSEVEPSVVFL